MSFTEQQTAALSAKLNQAHVKERNQAGRTLSYIEGWVAIAEANRIFGFGAWERETVDLRCVSERERAIGAQKRPGWSVSYVARVRVRVWDGERWIVREGCGAGHGIDVDAGQAHESALKEAETDAMKRALMTFGNPFGLALYDKEQRNVGAAEPEPPKQQPKKPKPEWPASVRETADTIKAAMDKAADVPEVNQIMSAYAADLESLPREISEFLENRAEKLRGILAQTPGRAA